MSDYMSHILKNTGVGTLDDLIKDENFIEYCKRFDDDIMTNFREKVESYIIFNLKKTK